MKLNKYWYVEKWPSEDIIEFNGYPTTILLAYTEKELEDVTIIHYSDPYFRPIALTKNEVISRTYYCVDDFYSDVCTLLKAQSVRRTVSLKYYRGWLSRRGIYHWGCRSFTRSQLLLIKRTMEWHYSKESLNG